MPSETIVSPGILAVENDQPFVLQLPVQADAAIIGPTVKGKVGIPTIVTSYSDYKNKYGETFVSGGTTYTYFTSLAAYNYFQNLSPNPGALLVTRVVSGSTTNDWTPATSSFISSSAHAAGAPYDTDVFVLETLSEGIIMNSVGPTGSNGTLLSGSSDNYRFQIVSPNTQSGTFSLIIRQGNDSATLMSIIDTIGPVSLDPNSSNYIEKVIGNQIELISQDPTTGEYYTQLSGSYPNKYSTIRVKQVNQPTPNYFDNNGLPKPQYTGSIPIAQSGVFGDGKGDIIPTIYDGLYNENITDANIQGLSPFAYTESISLLANKDAYNYNIITTPGLIADPNFFPDSNSVINQLINVVENRGNCMAIIDLAKYNENLGQVTSNAQNQDTSYAAAYWPWVKAVHPPNSSTQVWSPASTFIPGVYAFNDKNGYPWLAPAGVNRGVMTIATQTEKILTQGNRDILYQNKVNPIASIPTAQGGAIVVYGQKTLQTQNTSLTRVNVRRLLINLKNYISRIATSFVFEQNTPATREQFLSLVTPYLSIVQQQEGLTAFQVIMDESNNPPEVVDQNQLIGQIYLQPTKTAEFILLDFNILPTGATFPTQ
jgi:hypothetical protein